MMASPPLVPVLVATAAIFIVGWLWYSPLLFLKPWMRLRGLDPAVAMGGKMPMGRVGVELVRCFIVSYLVAHLVVNNELHHVTSAIHSGIFYWVTFPVMVFVGQVTWENVNWKVAAINAGDWLVKLILIPVIVVLMQ
jgi:hypothetical protein